ncbi:DUF4158 domain-containing protein [Nonomuraea sp. NPDC049655]|uniref:DUF4158 domain-containing protein n=1 Tax=Nonomuraea sp. NPDC049655 TaxID=3364355 RepID=UPI0037B786CB
MFTDEELARLRSFPEISREESIRFFTLTAADAEFIDPGRARGPADRLGLAGQLCVLPWPGFVPADVASAPPAAGRRLRQALPAHPDGARIIAASQTSLKMAALSELVSSTPAGRDIPRWRARLIVLTVLRFTVGYVLEEQAGTYWRNRRAAPARTPRTASTWPPTPRRTPR